jgi:hypothetical protein
MERRRPNARVVCARIQEEFRVSFVFLGLCLLSAALVPFFGCVLVPTSVTE